MPHFEKVPQIFPNIRTFNRPYLWGPKAVEHQAMRYNFGASLHKQPSVEQILDALDPSLLYQSSLQFPVSRKIHTREVAETEKLKYSDAMYDPSFLLPLFNHLSGSGEFNQLVM